MKEEKYALFNYVYRVGEYEYNEKNCDWNSSLASHMKSALSVNRCNRECDDTITLKHQK